MSPSEHSVRARVAERLRRLAAVVDPQRTSPSGGIVTVEPMVPTPRDAQAAYWGGVVRRASRDVTA